MRLTVLYFRQGTSDKFYEIGIYRVGEDRGAPTFKVICRYGRRGAAGKEEIKTPQPVYNGEAYEIAMRIEREKRAKGYRDGATEYAPRSDSEAQRLRGEQLLREVMAPSYTLRARPADARPAFTPPRDNGIRLERPARRAATPPPAPKPVFTSPLKSKRAYRLEDE
jgi:predicted DNA-binding WGR domain protein